MSTSRINQIEIVHPSAEVVEDGLSAGINPLLEGDVNVDTQVVSIDKSWLERNKKRIFIGGYLGAVALTLNELGPLKDQVAESAHWTVPAIIASETIATTGLAAMVAATGSKVGNPFTFRQRIKGFQGKLTNSSMFRAGAYMNLAGAAGTSAVIAGESISDFPVSAWPASLGVAGLSTALSLPFYKIARDKRKQEAGVQ